jgi:hypothetical protein
VSIKRVGPRLKVSSQRCGGLDGAVNAVQWEPMRSIQPDRTIRTNIMQDRHAVPTANFSRKRTSAAAMYSPTQALVGAFLGGPIGVIYFLHQNFVTLGQIPAARKCLIYGALAIPALLVLVLILPDKFPSAPFSLAYIFIAGFVAQKYQMTHQQIAESADYKFKSGGNVLGMAILCCAGSLIVIFVPLYLLMTLGLIA